MPKGNAVTVGTYDGVHRGHRKVFRTLIALARARGLKTLVVTFEEPPKNFFRPDAPTPLLTLPEEREELLLQLGIDRVELLRFDAAIAAMSAEDYFHQVLRGRYQTRAICEGEDFGFGHDRRGNIALLHQLCANDGVALKVMPLAKRDDQKISSTYIRLLLGEGEVEQAAALLGYRYFLTGTVVRGQGLGARLRVPTANLQVDRRKVLPRGVFAVRVRLPGDPKPVKGACNIGFRPTVAGGEPSLHVEVHLIGFSGELYGRSLRIEFVKHIRPERKFPSLLALKRQIKKDIAAAS